MTQQQQPKQLADTQASRVTLNISPLSSCAPSAAPFFTDSFRNRSCCLRQPQVWLSSVPGRTAKIPVSVSLALSPPLAASEKVSFYNLERVWILRYLYAAGGLVAMTPGKTPWKHDREVQTSSSGVILELYQLIYQLIYQLSSVEQTSLSSFYFFAVLAIYHSPHFSLFLCFSVRQLQASTSKGLFESDPFSWYFRVSAWWGLAHYQEEQVFVRPLWCLFPSFVSCLTK